MTLDGPVIIDFPQAVDPAVNASARKLLIRDVDNLLRFLVRHVPGARPLPYAQEMWELYQANFLTPETVLRGRASPSNRPTDTADVLALIGDADREHRHRTGNPPPKGPHEPKVETPAKTRGPAPRGPKVETMAKPRGPRPRPTDGPRRAGEPHGPREQNGQHRTNKPRTAGSQPSRPREEPRAAAPRPEARVERRMSEPHRPAAPEAPARRRPLSYLRQRPA